MGRSGKEAVSPPPPPLRTGRESFPSSGSSGFKAPRQAEPVHCVGEVPFFGKRHRERL